MELIVNGIEWNIYFVHPLNSNLITNNGIYTLGMTDNNKKAVFLSDILKGELLYNVLCHELVHVYCFSYNILLDIEDEERMAQFISDFGKSIIYDTDLLLNTIFHHRIVL